jgi:hypothetical protein
MYKANFVIGKNYNKYTTTEEQIKGLTEKKFFTLKGAMRFIEKNNFFGVVLDSNNHIIYEGNKKHYTFKEDNESYKDIPDEDSLEDVMYFRTEYFKPEDYNSLKYLSYKLNEIFIFNNEGEVNIGINNFGLYIYFKLYNKNNVKSLLDYYHPLMKVDESYEDLKNMILNKYSENYYDFAFNKKFTREDIVKAKKILESMQKFYFLGNE